MDSMFLLDLILQFNIAYVDHVTVKLITRHDMIAMHYLKASFLVDLIASLPYQLLMELLPMEDYANGAKSLCKFAFFLPYGFYLILTGSEADCTCHLTHFSDLRRLLILIPLLRLFRLSRAKRIFLRMEQLYSIDHGMLSIITFIVQTAMLCHFCACLWGLVPLFQGHDDFGSFQHDHSVGAAPMVS